MHFSNPIPHSKKDAFVAIQELQSHTSGRPQPANSSSKASWTARLATHVRRFLWRFFPFVGEPPPAHLDDIHKKASFPWFGLSCLIIALSTLVFSFLIFHFINHKVQIESKYLKPASWLSALISVNSIFLHIALSEGVTTAWWYKASRADVTLQELHETWTMGTSTVAVLLSGKKFNYVAMATIFVATVPLNGFLLQNAISLVPDTHQNHTTLHVPVLQQLPPGFSADMTNGSIESWSQALSSVASSFDGLYTLPPGVFQTAGSFEDIGCVNGGYSAVCKTHLTIPGFDMSCTTDMAESYDLRPSQHSRESTYRVTVFSSSVTWNVSDPNLISLDMWYKPNTTCQGSFERKRCQLRAASMSLPIQINSNQGFNVGTDWSSPNYAIPVISIDANATMDDIKSMGTISKYPGEGQENTTYGGVAQWLGQRFNGSIDWTLKDGSWSSNRSGTVANTYTFNNAIYFQDKDGNVNYNSEDGTTGPLPFNPKPDNTSWCNNTYSGLDWLTDSGWYGAFTSPTDTIFHTLNQLMLGASVTQFTTQWNNNDTFWDIWYNLTSPADDEFETKEFQAVTVPIPNATQTQNVLRYKIRYAYWGASVAVTVGVVLMIIPLFYGFWHLDRRATLSPFETAAAFNAPVLVDADMKKGTSVLLKEIGKRPVHADAPGSSAASLQPPTGDPKNNPP